MPVPIRSAKISSHSALLEWVRKYWVPSVKKAKNTPMKKTTRPDLSFWTLLLLALISPTKRREAKIKNKPQWTNLSKPWKEVPGLILFEGIKNRVSMTIAHAMAHLYIKNLFILFLASNSMPKIRISSLKPEFDYSLLTQKLYKSYWAGCLCRAPSGDNEI